MWAIVTKNGGIIGRDFKSKADAINHKNYYVSTRDAVVIDQNSKKFIELDMKAKRK